MSTYDIERRTLDLLDALADEGGDLDAFEAEITALLGDGVEAVRRAWFVVHRIQDEEAHQRATAAHFAVLARSSATAGERVRGIIARLLEAREALGEAPSVRGFATLCAPRPSLVIADDIDADALPDALVRIRREPSKTAIREALDRGEAVPGASLVDTRTVRIQRRK